MSFYPKAHPKMRRPRGRMPSPKPGQLQVGWACEDRFVNPELHFCYGGGGATSRDNHMLINAFHLAKTASGKCLVEELVDRGYDLSTLKFSIEKLPE